jgi:hypothetical protein
VATTAEYSLSWILPLVRESLRERSNFTFDNYIEGLWQVFERIGLPGVQKKSALSGYTGSAYDFSTASYDLRFAATEAFFYLVRSGLIIPGAPTNSTAFSGFPSQGTYFMTSRGRSWASSVEPFPEDFDGYMKLLRQLVPNLDLVIAQYISEGLSSFVRETYFAAAVMIGAASEKAIYLLAESMLHTFKTEAQQTKLEKLMGQRSLNSLFGLVEKTITDAHSADLIPYAVVGGASRHLMSLIESIRVQRNDAVHPMNAQVSADSVRHSFAAFPHALEKVEALRVWFLKNPKTI